jgi:hypothetical protein
MKLGKTYRNSYKSGLQWHPSTAENAKHQWNRGGYIVHNVEKDADFRSPASGKKNCSMEIEGIIAANPDMTWFFQELVKDQRQRDAFVELLKWLNAGKFGLAGFQARARTLFSSNPEMYTRFAYVWTTLGGTTVKCGPPTLLETVAAVFSSTQAAALALKNR